MIIVIMIYDTQAKCRPLLKGFSCSVVSKHQWSNRTSIFQTNLYGLVIMTSCAKPAFLAVLESDKIIGATC